MPADVIPPDPDNREILDHCRHYQNFSIDTNVTVKGCPLGWEYSDEIYSIVQEVGHSHFMSMLPFINSAAMLQRSLSYTWAKFLVCFMSYNDFTMKHEASARCPVVRSVKQSNQFWPNSESWSVKTFQRLFSCDQAALWVVQSICLSVCLSVRHTFFTMLPSSSHHEIFRSYYQWQKWCPCKRSRSEVKSQGHRGQNPSYPFQDCKSQGLKKSSNLTQIGRFRTITPVWIHQWLWNDAQSLK